MLIVAVNGSPRKTWNTATLLQHALDGAKAECDARGIEATCETVHLYDLDYTGCRSCFACKRKGSKSYGRCAVRDGLAPALELLSRADVIVFGSPIYFGDLTGQMRSLLERLMFPFHTYESPSRTAAPKRTRTGFIATMNVTREEADRYRYTDALRRIELFIGHTFSKTETLLACNTLQFDDYSKYEAAYFDAEDKARAHAEQFPLDCEAAFEMGKRLAAQAAEKGTERAGA